MINKNYRGRRTLKHLLCFATMLFAVARFVVAWFAMYAAGNGRQSTTEQPVFKNLSGTVIADTKLSIIL